MVRNTSHDQNFKNLIVDYPRQALALFAADEAAALDDSEMRTYQERYPQENRTMATLSERLLGEGRQQGRLEGKQEGELALLARQLSRRFGPLDASVEERLQQASTEELERWTENILDARTLDEVFAIH